MFERIRSSIYTWILCALYCVTLIIGIWHAFPNMDVSHDEATYVWDGVTALTSNRITPQIDAAYSISYYLNFFTLALVGFLFFKGDFSQLLTSIQIETIWTWKIFLIPRIISLIATLVLLAFFLTHVRRLHLPKGQGFAITTLLFTNILFSVIAHTGKMWMVSILLFFLSYYFLTESYLHAHELKEKIWYRNPVFYMVLFAFLATANFPLSGISLLNPVFLFYILKKQKQKFSNISQALFPGVLIGGALFALALTLNWQGWHSQGTSLLFSLRIIPYTLWRYVLVGSLITMPLLLINLVQVRRIIYRPLFIALAIHLTYFVAVLSLVATGVGTEPSYYYRYLLIPIVIVALMLLLVEFRSKKIMWFTVALSLLFFVKTLYLLQAPTTYNVMLSHVRKSEWVHSLLINQVPEVDLFWLKKERGDDMNVLEATQNMEPKRMQNLIAPLMKRASGLHGVYLLTDTPYTFTLAYAVQNGSRSDGYYATIDDGLGPYTYNSLYLERLGEPLYLYLILVKKS